MNEYTMELTKLGMALTELAVKETITKISSKIKSIKQEKNAEVIRNTYDEIVNELIHEREEAVRIAQTYKSELEKVIVCDDDIDRLHNTASRIIELFKESEIKKIEKNDTITDKEEKKDQIEQQIEEFEQLKELISSDVLKTMQLLGFNYKEAIGEPLTILLRNIILSKTVEPDPMNVFGKLLTPEMIEVLKKKESYSNFKDLINYMGNNTL